MGIYNPLYNEETGWAALDQLTPEQQAFMNPAAFGSGYGMNVGAANNPTNTFGQFTGYQGGSQLPAGYDPYAVSNGVAGMNFQFPSGSNLGGGGNNWITQNFTTPNNTVAPSNTLTPASAPPPSSGSGGSTSLTGGGSSSGGNRTPVIGSPSLANNMQMTGAENVGGVGMYTGANGPLNMSLFAPQGQEAAIMSGSMGGLGEMLFKAAQQGGLNPNTSYLGFMDELSRRALAAKGGQGGLLPQDFVNYMNSQAGQQWFQGMRTPAQTQPPGTPTGSPVIQQTGPQNPPVAPLPSQQVRPPGSGANSLTTGGVDPNPQVSMRGYPGMNYGGGYNPNYGGPQVDPARGMGQVPQYLQQMDQAMINARNSGQQFDYNSFLQQNFNPQQMGLQIDPQRPDYYVDPRTGDRYTRSGATMIPAQQWSQFISSGNGMSPAGGQQTPVIGSPGMIGGPAGAGQVSPEFQQRIQQMIANGWQGDQLMDLRTRPDGSRGSSSYKSAAEEQYAMQQLMAARGYGNMGMVNQGPTFPQSELRGWEPGMLDNRGPNFSGLNLYTGQNPFGPNGNQQYPLTQQGPNWNDLSDYGRQQYGMPTAQQWQQTQGGSQQPNYNNIDFRAATFGSGSGQGTPPAGGGYGTIPNTTNPLNPLAAQTQYRAPGFGGATNRLAGFGNTSLFGTPYTSGGSTGFGGTNPSQFRGNQMYGRAASYGQSQRPY